MTDRHRTLTVVLDHDMRSDDVEAVVDAIKMIRCVSKVMTGDAVGGDDICAADDYRRAVGSMFMTLQMVAGEPRMKLRKYRLVEVIRRVVDGPNEEENESCQPTL